MNGIKYTGLWLILSACAATVNFAFDGVNQASIRETWHNSWGILTGIVGMIFANRK